MTALELLQRLRDEWKCVPHDDIRRWPASNGQLRRWLNNGSVRINGTRPKPEQELTFPVTELVYFPGRARQVTVW